MSPNEQLASRPGQAQRTPEGVHVITTESFAGDPVDAGIARLQAILDNSLTA